MSLVKHQDLLCSCQKAALTLLHLGSTRAVCLSCTRVQWHTLLQGIHPHGSSSHPAAPQHAELFWDISPGGCLEHPASPFRSCDMQVGFPSETSRWECTDFVSSEHP